MAGVGLFRGVTMSRAEALAQDGGATFKTL